MLSIHKPLVLIGALALMLGTSAHADHIKVFLLGGQSNMEGNNAMLGQLPAYLQPAQENVAPADGMVVVTATIAGTLVDRLFVDLEVIQN